MREIVSASLGSSKRDHQVEVELLGEKFNIRRIGMDGDFGKIADLLKDLDGKVDAIGLGGIDIFLTDGTRQYAIRDGEKLQALVRRTPIVDGSKLKNVLERETVRFLVEERDLPLCDKTVLMVSAVDRFGMAEALAAAGCSMIFGDLIFGLKIPVPIRSISNFKNIAHMLLPFATKLPFQMLYPVGEEQDKEPESKYRKYYDEADIIAGDYLYIKRYMPLDMQGKWIITNTITASDIEDLKERGVELLVTSTPEFDGRSFGTNVIEAVLVSLLDKPWEAVGPSEYLGLLKKLDFKPRVIELAGGCEIPDASHEPRDTKHETRQNETR